LAVAGATTIRSAQRASSMWPIAASAAGSHSEVRTGCPDSAWKVCAPTKRCAFSVIATRTPPPASRRRRTRSAALYAAMPPHTHSRMRRPSRRRAVPLVGGVRPAIRATAYPMARRVPAARPGRARWNAGMQTSLPRTAMHIREWPLHERPREKLVLRGASALSDAELLAIFLGSGLRGMDAVATARQLLAEHGPLRRLLELTPEAMASLPGLGPARASSLAAALALGNRWLAAGPERGEAMTDPAAAGRYFAQRLRSLPHEVFAALFLDTRHRAIAFEELFRGTVDGAEVHPREVVRRALAHNAAALIVGHNHPSGNPDPSA